MKLWNRLAKRVRTALRGPCLECGRTEGVDKLGYCSDECYKAFNIDRL